MNSTYLKSPDTIWAYKPSSYKKTIEYPVVFLLHGHSANYKAWSKLADLQKLADQYSFIIVCPDGLKKSWYLNSPLRDSSQFESFFIKELMPKIFEIYSADRKSVFISGASMGGYGAMWLFLRHPNLFLSAGSTSGVLNLRYSGFKKTTLAEHLGIYSDENKAFDDYSAINNLINIVGLNKSIIFDCGTEDYLYSANKKFRDKCDELKIKATYIAQPGAHTGSYWSGSILTHFSFFSDLASREKIKY